jgi:hypothetical protein
LRVEVEPVFDLVALLAALGAGATPRPSRIAMHPGAGAREPLLPPIEPARITGDADADLEHCRTIADWARWHAYLAIWAPSAAVEGELTIAIYPENRPRGLRIAVESDPIPLNYGSDPFLDAGGSPRRRVP